MIPETIAAVCHEANRRYCRENGDRSQKSWEEAPWWQRQSAIAGVMFVLQNPAAHPSASHENWLKLKVEEGWTYGPVKDEETKTHPCILPYEGLPDTQKVKDTLFRNIVLALTQGENHVA